MLRTLTSPTPGTTLRRPSACFSSQRDAVTERCARLGVAGQGSPAGPPHTVWASSCRGQRALTSRPPPLRAPRLLHLGREDPRHSSVTSWSAGYGRSQTVQEPHMQTFGPSRSSLIFLFIKLHIPPPTYILRGGERKCGIMTLSRTAFLQNHE